MTTKQTVSRARVGYQKANERAADVILRDAAKYGGPESLMVVWARGIQAENVKRIDGPLFAKAAA